MARITREARRQKKELLDNFIWEVFKSEGWDAVTYQRLADKLGTTKSTIQRYYPSQVDFLEGIEGRALGEMLPFMDLSSADSFSESWTQMVVTNPLNHHYLELVVIDAMSGLNRRFAMNASNNLMGFMIETFHLSAQEAQKRYANMLGDAILRTMQANAVED